MSRIKINGNKKLTGTIEISGAKNSVVALIPASILCDEESVITNVPNITDVDALEEILMYLNVGITIKEKEIKINTYGMKNITIKEELSNKLRASYYFMGALLGKYKHVDIYFPGGCVIGKRPINLHLLGFEKLGATIKEDGNKFTIDAEELIGTNIYLDFPSVGATINIMLAATKAKGTTIIENAAEEPEIENIADFLNSMGAKITGAGTNTITIEGVEYLHKGTCKVIPDRIEAGTYVIISSLLGANIKIENVIPRHIESLTSKLEEAGVKLKKGKDYISIKETKKYHSVKVKTLVYPGFPTDLQQPLVSFLTQCEGISTVEETIYENRFANVPDINKMGANIKVEENRIATIKGITKLTGTNVHATDLRGGASLVIAGLISEGTTYIDNIEYILRGYPNIIEKLKNVGADIDITE